MNPSVERRIYSALKEIEQSGVLNKQLANQTALEMFRTRVANAIFAIDKYDNYIAAKLCTSEATVTRIKIPQKRKRAYDFKLAFNLSLLTADNYEEALELLALSGNPLEIDSSMDMQRAIAAMRLIYSERIAYWETRLEIAESVIWGPDGINA